MTKLSDITKLVDHLNKAIQSGELTEASLKTADVELKLKKEHPPVIATSVAAPAFSAAPAAAATASAAPSAASAPTASADNETSTAAAAGDVIKSPMVGTAYLSPEPGKPAFVSVGDQVSAGDTLMIIEAMKVMNTLEAPRAGTIAEIMVPDGSPIEFDEPLFVLS